jgi:hypothetical protein
MNNVNSVIKDLSTFVYLIQEPLLNKELHPAGLNPSHKKYYIRKPPPRKPPRPPPGWVPPKVIRTRALIYAHFSMPLWPEARFSDPDCSVCRWESPDFGTIMLVSLYWDADLPELPKMFKKVVDYCIDNRIDILVGTDSNARAYLWGDVIQNPRGTLLEDYIDNKSLFLLNTGAGPTYQRDGASSTIDISLASNRLSNYISYWGLSQDPSFSDHAQIEIHLELSAPDPRLVRSYGRIDWPTFTDHMDKKSIKIVQPDHTSIALLESELTSFNKDTTAALDAVAKLHPQKGRESDKWYTQELVDLKKQYFALLNKKNLNGSQRNKDKFVEIRNLYNNTLKSTRAGGWKTFTSSVSDIKGMALFLKIIKKAPTHQVGILKHTDGTFTNSAAESLNLLMDTHFKNSIPPSEDEEETDQVSFESEVTGRKYVYQLDWVSTDLIVEAFRTFKPRKMEGLDGFKPCVLQNLPLSAIHRLK